MTEAGERRSNKRAVRRVVIKPLNSDGAEDVKTTTVPRQLTLGKKLRQLRLARSLSLQDVAHQTGLSRSFLSLVENDHSDIALSRLLRITELYHLPLGNLFDEDDIGPVHLIRKADIRELRTRERGVKIEIMTTHRRRQFETYRISLAPGTKLSGLRHAGDEWAHVLVGRVHVELTSKGQIIASHVIEAGDSIYFNTELGHTYMNVAKRVSVIMGVIDQPPPDRSHSIPGGDATVDYQQ